MDENEKLKEVLKHLRNISSKASSLDNSLTSLKSTLNNNVVLNSVGYKVSDVESVQKSISSMNYTLSNSTIPSIKKRVEN